MIYTISANGETDGVAHALVQRVNSKIPIVLASRVQNYIFNEQLLELVGKDWCLIDYTELGWDWKREFGHQWGVNSDKFDFYSGEEWKKLDDFIKANPPKISFVRELLLSEVKENVYPIQYPCFINPIPIQTFEEFNNRPFEVFFNFGISNEYRKELHGNIWRRSGEFGYNVLDCIYHINQCLENEKGKKWMSIHTAHYVRQPIENIMAINGLAKISISLPGAGVSCFRTAESPVNSTMLMQKDTLSWSIPWTEENCILSEPRMEIETAIEALDNPEKLYGTYKRGVENVDKYRTERYCREYIEPLINVYG